MIEVFVRPGKEERERRDNGQFTHRLKITPDRTITRIVYRGMLGQRLLRGKLIRYHDPRGITFHPPKP